MEEVGWGRVRAWLLECHEGREQVTRLHMIGRGPVWRGSDVNVQCGFHYAREYTVMYTQKF